MNLFLRVMIIAILGSAMQLVLPWWCVVIVALFTELLIGKRDNTAFFSGFYGVAIPWMILASYIDIKSASILSLKVAELLHLPPFAIVLIVLTGLLGGVAGGIGSVAGDWIKDAILHTDGK